MAYKIDEAIESCQLEPTEELEVFAESVALLISFWAKVKEWTPLEKASYFGYVMTKVAEKGLDVEIKRFDEFKKTMFNKGN